MDELDGRDERLRRAGVYDHKYGLVPKLTAAEEHIARYEDPWGPCYYSRYLDQQPAQSPSDLRFGRLFTEHGELAVLGYGACPPIIGIIVIGIDDVGDITLAIHALRNDGRTRKRAEETRVVADGKADPAPSADSDNHWADRDDDGA